MQFKTTYHISYNSDNQSLTEFRNWCFYINPSFGHLQTLHEVRPCPKQSLFCITRFSYPELHKNTHRHIQSLSPMLGAHLGIEGGRWGGWGSKDLVVAYPFTKYICGAQFIILTPWSTAHKFNPLMSLPCTVDPIVYSILMGAKPWDL